jgi:hypothetical protein
MDRAERTRKVDVGECGHAAVTLGDVL